MKINRYARLIVSQEHSYDNVLFRGENTTGKKGRSWTHANVAVTNVTKTTGLGYKVHATVPNWFVIVGP